MAVRLLRGCLTLSAAALLVGLLWSLAVARGAISPSSYPDTVIRAALCILVAIPVLNLFAVLAGAVKKGDRMMAAAVVLVLVMLAFNVVWLTVLRPK